MALLASRNGTVRWPAFFFMSRKLNVKAPRPLALDPPTDREPHPHRPPVRLGGGAARIGTVEPAAVLGHLRLDLGGLHRGDQLRRVSASSVFTVPPTVAFSFAGGV